MADEKKPTPDPHEGSREDAETMSSGNSNVERPEDQEATAEAAAPRRPDAAAPSEPAEEGIEEQPEKPGGKIFVVGIGASAGGLEAIGELIRDVPTDGMAYIVVQHLAPDHESLLTQLLARDSRMQVVTAADGMTLESNHVYVIPPKADLAVMDGVIHVMTPAEGQRPQLPIDYLFRSIAEDQGHSAIGVVLSGTGTDGTLGVKAIKAVGGFTFVQDPSTAKYDGMPRSAYESGAADYCLPLKGIAEELARIAKQGRGRPAARRAVEPALDENQLGKILVLIRAELGNDLTQYKQATIDRRIARRMMFHGLERLEDYVKLVQQDGDELHALYEDILISVTRFFREPEAFETLKTKVFPRVFEERTPNQPIRVWVPACSTGEEAYSLAMCLLEFLEEKKRDDRVQIFGTDIDDKSIQHARRGVYPVNIALDVSPERLHRFFLQKNNEYQISRRIRDMLVFSRQNILRDAPFSHLDLVSCRNLLIYLKPNAQGKVLRTLHYALKPTGHLLLGTSETVGDAPELFSSVDRKNKIYVKKLVASQATFELGASSAPAPGEPTREPSPTRPTLDLQGLADRKVLELHGPPGVVVSEEFDVVQFRGHTGPYLDPTPGAASFNVLKVARFELHVELTRALHQARSEQRRVTTEVSFHEDGKPCLVELDVAPLQDSGSEKRYFLVLFKRLPPPKEVPVVSPDQAGSGDSLPLVERNQELERELATTKDYLQATLEERESTLEELKSANEELQSSNEELQSTNEELETSQEEMQSTNEELTTVNDELHDRMTELSQANDDLYNILAGVDNAVVIVGMDLRIRRYTRAAEELLNLIPGDVGRSIAYLDAFLGSGVIEPKVSTVIHGLSTLTEEVLASNKRWYELKVSPYKTLDHAIRGALITLIDIDVRRRTMDVTRDVGAYATRFLGAINHPLLILDRHLRVVWVNDALLSTLQLSSEETVGSTLGSLGTQQLADPGLHARLEDVFDSASVLRAYEMRFPSPDGGEQAAHVGASLIPASTDVPLALLSIESTGRAGPADQASDASSGDTS